jgi:hypothetical protein
MKIVEANIERKVIAGAKIISSDLLLQAIVV